MISVQRVYEVVRDICNKDQKGFVTPNVFNTLARMAQQNIYNEMFSELKLATALRASGRDAGRDKSAYKMVEEDLSTFIRTRNVQIDSLVSEDLLLNGEDGAFIFRRPEDFTRLIAMNVIDTDTSVELIFDNEKASRILNSNLSAPTEEFPVALEMTDVFQVFPSTVDGVSMRYYRQPRSRIVSTGLVDFSAHPTYSTLEIDQATGFTLFNEFDSRNFDLPEHYINEVVSEIVKMTGVRLRDTTLAAYGLQQTQAE